MSYGSVVILSLPQLRHSLKQKLRTLITEVSTKVILTEIKPLQFIDDYVMSYYILSTNHQSIYTHSLMKEFHSVIDLTE